MTRHARNVHERRLGHADPAAVRVALDRLAEPGAGVWPADRWPALRLDRGLVPGSSGGHGPIRYSVQDVRPDGLTFRFDPAMGVDGEHRFEVERDGSDAVVRHTIDARLHGPMRLMWPVLIEPLHDALIEDALDGVVAASAGGTVQQRAALPPGVRWRRQLLSMMRRLDDDRPTPTRRRAAVGAGATLVGIGILHAAWARRLTTWPGRDVADLARTVVGGDRFPSARATWAVAGLCMAAGASVTSRVSSVTGVPRLAGHAASRTVAGVLGARGAGGLVVSRLGLAPTTPRFRRNDMLVYSPLCLALAAGAFVAGGTGRAAR